MARQQGQQARVSPRSGKDSRGEKGREAESVPPGTERRLSPGWDGATPHLCSVQGSGPALRGANHTIYRKWLLTALAAEQGLFLHCF